VAHYQGCRCLNEGGWDIEVGDGEEREGQVKMYLNEEGGYMSNLPLHHPHQVAVQSPNERLRGPPNGPLAARGRDAAASALSSCPEIKAHALPLFPLLFTPPPSFHHARLCNNQLHYRLIFNMSASSSEGYDRQC
jgi:hypothetical protein